VAVVPTDSCSSIASALLRFCWLYYSAGYIILHGWLSKPKAAAVLQLVVHCWLDFCSCPLTPVAIVLSYYVLIGNWRWCQATPCQATWPVLPGCLQPSGLRQLFCLQFTSVPMDTCCVIVFSTHKSVLFCSWFAGVARVICLLLVRLWASAYISRVAVAHHLMSTAEAHNLTIHTSDVHACVHVTLTAVGCWAPHGLGCPHCVWPVFCHNARPIAPCSAVTWQALPGLEPRWWPS